MTGKSLNIGIAGTGFMPGTGPATYFQAIQECLAKDHNLCLFAGCGPVVPDLVHLVDAKRVPLQALHAMPVPVIADFHDHYWTSFQPFPAPDLLLRLVRQRSLLSHHLEVLKRSAAVIVHSRAVAGSIQETIQKNLKNGPPVHVVPYGIKASNIGYENTAEADPASPLILFAGRDMFRKGFPVAVKALRKVREKKPGARLRVIGEEYVHTRFAARLLSLGQPVEFLPAQSPGELERHYSEASVLVLPSRQEAFGIVLVEAMAAGLPVAAARQGGIPEAVEDGVSGLLHKPGDSADLADKILALLDDSGIRERIVQGGHERARSFSLSAMKKSLERAYFSVAEGAQS
ncbi:MAG: glycosyltransferase family 4 protein [bacterium]